MPKNPVPKTKPRAPRALYVTADAVERAPNDRLLEAFEQVGQEVVRRLNNYRAMASSPNALLDGIRFAAKADTIATDFMFGDMLTPMINIYNGTPKLTALLAGTSSDVDDDA